MISLCFALPLQPCCPFYCSVPSSLFLSLSSLFPSSLPSESRKLFLLHCCGRSAESARRLRKAGARAECELKIPHSSFKAGLTPCRSSSFSSRVRLYNQVLMYSKTNHEGDQYQSVPESLKIEELLVDRNPKLKPSTGSSKFLKGRLKSMRAPCAMRGALLWEASCFDFIPASRRNDD